MVQTEAIHMQTTIYLINSLICCFFQSVWYHCKIPSRHSSAKVSLVEVSLVIMLGFNKPRW